MHSSIEVHPLPGEYEMKHTQIFAHDGKKLGDRWEKIYNGKVISETNGTHVHKGYLYQNGELVFEYDASKHGAVVAIKIELDDQRNSIATLAFAFEGVEPIEINWCCITERDAFEYGINGYTVIDDRRYPNRDFESYVKKG